MTEKGSQIMSEDSRDATSSQQDGMPAFLVQPHSAKRRQNAEQIIAPHLDHLQLRLLEDIEEGTVNLEHRLKHILGIEDVLDIFFLPKLVVAFEEDADKEKSIIEIIQDAVERQRERTTPPQFCTTFDSSYKEYLDYKADEESQTDYEEELRVARAKFFTKKKQWLERERKRMNPKQVELVDVACTERAERDEMSDAPPPYNPNAGGVRCTAGPCITSFLQCLVPRACAECAATQTLQFRAEVTSPLFRRSRAGRPRPTTRMQTLPPR